MVDHISNRNKIVQFLREELVGPSPAGQELDTSSLPLKFDSREKSYGPFVEKETGEEIITRDYPTKRYGIGVLYPFGTKESEPALDKARNDAIGMTVHLNADETLVLPDNETDVAKRVRNIENASGVVNNLKSDDNPIDYDLSLANAYQPSSMGVSFLAEVTGKSKLIMKFEGGRYLPVQVIIESFQTEWWVRKPIHIEVEIEGEKLLTSERVVIYSDKMNTVNQENTADLNIRFEVFSRKYGNNQALRLITVSIVNRTDGSSELKNNAKCIFQSQFSAKISSDKTLWNIYPYPSRESLDEEERSLELLYRNFPTFCVGHGCAGDWDKNIENTRSTTVYAKALPTFETPSTTPDITDVDGNSIKVPMAPLAGLVAGNDGFDTLEELVQLYENWISEKKTDVKHLPNNLIPAAERHLVNAQICANRMKRGLKFLEQDKMAAQAFQLANRAILFQQIRPKDKRAVKFNEATSRIEFNAFEEVDPLSPGAFQGSWRAFQIAFLLMAIESTALGTVPDREIVELIWFPTGGGKTEAYLGLIAFSICWLLDEYNIMSGSIWLSGLLIRE